MLRRKAPDMSSSPQILSGFREIAAQYDALVCDVWGVLHNGVKAFAPACDALKRFRAEQGPVVLLSNAPRPEADLKAQFAKFGVPHDCYDAIVTSGIAARADLAGRAEKGRVRMYHLGPERDRGVFEGLAVDCVDLQDSEVALCTGLFDDDVETPDDYSDTLAEMKAHGLVMICANPDFVVQRGGVLVYCAGALAEAYEKIGGKVTYYGKPHAAIYKLTLAAAKGAKHPLAIGDGLKTDIRGANAAGLDALFIGNGIHGEHVEPFTPPHLSELFASEGVSARAAMRTLVW